MQCFFRVLCLLTDRNSAASIPDFWKNFFYKLLKTGALPKDWSTANSTLHVWNGKHPGYHLACGQANSKHGLEHSEDKTSAKVEEGTTHSLCFYHRYFMSNCMKSFLLTHFLDTGNALVFLCLHFKGAFISCQIWNLYLQWRERELSKEARVKQTTGKNKDESK